MLRYLDDEERIRLKQRCVEKPELTLPNVTWCSSNETRYNSTEIALGMYGHVPQPGCSLVTEGGGSGPWQHLYIIPKAKLAFCGIPKGEKDLYSIANASILTFLVVTISYSFGSWNHSMDTICAIHW
jgi:hypothetical protein